MNVQLSLWFGHHDIGGDRGLWGWKWQNIIIWEKDNQSKHFKVLFLLVIFLQGSLCVILIDEVPSKEVALMLEGDSILKEVFAMAHGQMFAFMIILHNTSGL